MSWLHKLKPCVRYFGKAKRRLQGKHQNRFDYWFSLSTRMEVLVWKAV